MINLTGKSVFVKTQEEYLSVLKIARFQGFKWARENHLNHIEIPFPNILIFYDNKTVTYSFEKTLLEASKIVEDEKKIKDAVKLVRTFAKYPDRTTLTDSFIKSLKLLADTVESQMEEVKQMTDEIFGLMECFPGSYINRFVEIILSEKGNVYFTAKNCTDKEDIICKLLEWCSRPMAKGEPYSSHKRNNEWREQLISSLNRYLGTNFGQEDMYWIYDQLGNAVNHKLTLRFIRSDFNMAIIYQKVKEVKQMERLTKISEIGNAYYPKCFEEPCCGMGECLDDKCSLMLDACKKLAEYEQLEEQGLLVRLPCKVGDSVFIIVGKDISKQKIRKVEISDNGIIFKTNKQKRTFSIAGFGESVFLTREEAEKKLEEMKKNGE